MNVDEIKSWQNRLDELYFELYEEFEKARSMEIVHEKLLNDICSVRAWLDILVQKKAMDIQEDL